MINTKIIYVIIDTQIKCPIKVIISDYTKRCSEYHQITTNTYDNSNLNKNQNEIYSRCNTK